MITVIEALRAFAIAYAVNMGRDGLELLSVLITASSPPPSRPDRLSLDYYRQAYTRFRYGHRLPRRERGRGEDIGASPSTKFCRVQRCRIQNRPCTRST